ncbi:MAG: STAS domain-containing protein [Actinomycetia bacterium]|nr:STAS domain-containing protein [Actinomycetes bacterium]
MNSARETSFKTIRVSAERLPKHLVRLKISGELDVAACNDLLPQIDTFVDKTARVLIVDLEDLRFMDSSGVKLLISFGNQFGFENVVIYKANRNILRVLEIIVCGRKFVYLASDGELEDWHNNLDTAA